MHELWIESRENWLLQNLDKLAIAPLGGTELNVFDNVCKVIFLQQSELIKEVVVVWVAVDARFVGC